MYNDIKDIKAQDNEYTMHTYKKFDVAFKSGYSATLCDVENKTYIDFGSGIGTNALGYGNKEWINAVTEQAKNIAHSSNLYYNPIMSDLAESLCKVTGMSKVFYGNSGAEANECAIKLARKYSFMKYSAEKERNKIITLKNSFHGRTVTTISATGQDVFHNYFFPFTEGFIFADADIESIKALTDDKVCAFMIELIQGEGGVIPVKKSFVAELAAFAAEKDILIIVDEVQTGVSRTGSFLASEQFEITPDIVTLAKGLGGGLPIGACLCNEKLKDTFVYSDHGSTFGGNMVVTAGASVVVKKVSDKIFCEEVLRKGEYLKSKLIEALGDCIIEIRGMGLMLGVELKSGLNVREIAEKALEFGVVVLTAKTALRFLPPLIISYAEIDKGVAGLTEAINIISNKKGDS
ncbi:MAG: acetylornithine and succinylornithine aminotransferase [Clostridia bacterium]|nr:acetylornithine and succinylornithine aminotransferase [Clostridia bacterium]